MISVRVKPYTIKAGHILKLPLAMHPNYNNTKKKPTSEALIEFVLA